MPGASPASVAPGPTRQEAAMSHCRYCKWDKQSHLKARVYLSPAARLTKAGAARSLFYCVVLSTGYKEKVEKQLIHRAAQSATEE